MKHISLRTRKSIGWPRVAAILAAGALGLTAIPVAAQTVGTDTFGCTTPPQDTLHLDVSNPGPGDQVPSGGMVIHGVAFDRSATSGDSVDRVSLFLGARDQGGAHLADATLGMPNPHADPGSLHQTAGWAATITLPNSTGPNTLAVYAHSAVSDHESWVSIPFMLGQSSASNVSCISGTTAGTSAPTAAESIHLELSNPQPNSTVKAGDLVVQGIAFDADAMSGTSVDRVTFFLGNRDEGGTFLAETTPSVAPGVAHGLYQATVTMPDEVGGHTIFVYAHSSVSGHDASLSVPITVKR